MPPPSHNLGALPEPPLLGLPKRAMLVVAVLALLSLVGDFGFPLPAWGHRLLAVLDVVLAACFLVDLGLVLVHASSWQQALRQRWYEYLLVLLFLVSLVMLLVMSRIEHNAGILHALHLKSTSKLIIATTQLFILGALSLRVLRAQVRLLDTGIRPEFLLVGSFAALVLIGWLTLLLPAMTAPGQPAVSGIDALFTSTSASCVTGLIVRDTGTAFSSTGQFIIMALFQVGGMGIITFVALVSVASGRRQSIPQMLLLRDLVSARAISDVRRNILGIVLLTLIIESVGSFLLFLSLGDEMPLLRRWEWAVFHAISAFCNAGFSLESDSLIGFQTNWGINLSCMGLIILGGLGFPVMLNMLGLRLRVLRHYRRWRFLRARDSRGRIPVLSLQSKLTLVALVVLILGGTIGFAALEWKGVLAQHGWGNRLQIALFQAVTPRTAGFNSVPMENLQDATQIFIMVLMVIGAGPVSTGGGIKTVAFVVLLLTMRSMIAGRDEVEVFGRTLPRRIVHAAISVFVIYTMTAVLGTFGLALTDPEMALQTQSFEVISALSTVGLSTGITAQLSGAGKLLLIVAMFVGRVGPLTLFLSVFKKDSETQLYTYPEEEIVVS